MAKNQDTWLYIKNNLDKHETARTITPETRAIIDQYLQELSLLKKREPKTIINKYAGIVSVILNVPDIRKADENIILKVLGWINARKLSQNTERNYIFEVKKFLEWLVLKGYNKNISGDFIKEIELPKPLQTVKASDLITYDEFEKIIKKCKNSRDRCLIYLLWETGARPSDLEDLNWGDIKEDKDCLVLDLSGRKTKKRRIVPVVNAIHAVSAWKADYPNTITSDSPVFVSLIKPHEKMAYTLYRMVLQGVRKSAGIEKSISPKNLRHSRITDLRARGVSDSAVSMFAWGTDHSQMIKVYSHLSPEQSISAIKKAYGMNVDEKPVHTPDPKKCSRCGMMNPPSGNYCCNCMCALSTESAIIQKELVNEIESHPSYKKLVELLRDEIEITKKKVSASQVPGPHRTLVSKKIDSSQLIDIIERNPRYKEMINNLMLEIGEPDPDVQCIAMSHEDAHKFLASENKKKFVKNLEIVKPDSDDPIGEPDHDVPCIAMSYEEADKFLARENKKKPIR